LAQLALFRDILVRKKKDYSPWALFCFFCSGTVVSSHASWK